MSLTVNNLVKVALEKGFYSYILVLIESSSQEEYNGGYRSFGMRIHYEGKH